MSCIFTSSKYYKNSTSNPLDIAPPIGYQFLKGTRTSQPTSISKGELMQKQLNDRSIFKMLSSRRTQPQTLEAFLKVSKLDRKNEYITNNLLSTMKQQYTKEIFHLISSKFIPHWKPEYSMVELSQLLSKSATHIENYALSKFIFLCVGVNNHRLNYLYEYFNRRIIQYDVQCQVIQHEETHYDDIKVDSKHFTVFDGPQTITDVEHVKQLIQRVNQKNAQKDPLYSGVHYLLIDLVSNNLESKDFFQREVSHYPYLQYAIALVCGLLGDGQSAVVRLCGTLKHKTFELIFILKIIFGGKVSLCKPIGSNPFLPDVYLICEHFYKQNGDIVYEYLMANYELLKEFGDDKYLLNPMQILRLDVNSSVKSFNDGFFPRIRETLKQFKENSNTQFYPSKALILQKLPKFAIDLENIVIDMIKIKAEQPKKEQPTEEKVIQRNHNSNQEQRGQRGVFSFGKPKAH